MSTIREPPIAQVPQIASPDALNSTSVGQLSKDRINAIAHAAQYRAPTVCRLLAGRAYGRKPDNADLAQRGSHCRQPIVAVTHEPPARACGHLPDDLAFMHIGGCQLHLGDHPRPAQPHVQTKARERLAAGMVTACAGGCHQSDGSDRRGQTDRPGWADSPRWPPWDHRAVGHPG